MALKTRLEIAEDHLAKLGAWGAVKAVAAACLAAGSKLDNTALGQSPWIVTWLFTSTG